MHQQIKTMDMPDLVMVVTEDENSCRFNGQGKKIEYTGDLRWLIAVRERLLSGKGSGVYSDRITRFISMLWHWR